VSSPNEPQPELFADEMPLANPADAKDPALENINSVEEFPQEDGKIIKLPVVVGKNGEKFYRVGGRKYRLAQRALRAVAAFEEAVTELFAPTPLQPSKPRCRNKLATVPAEIAEKRYIDPFGKKQTDAFFIIAGWLVRARGNPNGPTWLEIMVYSRLTHPKTFKDDGFCQKFVRAPVAAIIDLDLHLLAESLRADYKATRAAFASLVKRGLLEEVKNKKTRGRKTVRFLWHPWMEETGLKPVSSEEQEASHPSETGVKPVSSQDVKKQRNSKEHEHDHVHALAEQPKELKAEEQDLLDQIGELTATENRTEHYRKCWIRRIREWPNPVFAAIGETRLALREGRIRESIGGTLNWHFENFRKAALKRRAANKKSSAGAA
jgi:hypothetical protein